jgi:Fic family protein
MSSPDIVRQIERVHALSTVIQEVPIPPYLRVELDTINIMRAVRGTTAIEGAEVSTAEVREIMRSPTRMTLPQARQRDEQEVKNAQQVMIYVANVLKRYPLHPITQDLICTIHELTTRNIPYESNEPGKYRNCPVSAADYQAPPADQVRRLMTEFVDWLNSPPAVNWDPIVRALAAHFYVVSIHPFGDGNGRTSRALESFLLYQGKVNARGFYSLANYYYQHRPEYVWHLDNTRFDSHNDLTPFIRFGLHGLVEELQAVHTQVVGEVRLISFRDYARDLFQHTGRLGTKAGARVFHLLIAMGRDPMPLTEIAASPLYRRMSTRTWQRDIALLKELELVRIEDGAVIPNVEVMEKFTLNEIGEGVDLDYEPTQLKLQEATPASADPTAPTPPSGRSRGGARRKASRP